MAKKKGTSSNSDSLSNSSDVKSDTQKGLSKEAWAAIATIVAALITGAVALLTHVLPAAPTPNQQPPPAKSSATAEPSTSTMTSTADAISGKWAGSAKDGDDKVFQITLEIRKGCTLNERCGVIGVSHVPCYGEVFLEKAQDTEFEFRVANFFGRSDRKACQPGAGEHFSLRADGKLAYSTTYQPNSQGLLDKIGN